MRDPHDLAIAQPVATAGSAADQGVRTGFEIIVVIRQTGDVDQPLHRQFAEPAKQPEILDSDDDGMESLADVVFQIREQLDADQLAFGGLGPALGAGAVLAEDHEFVMFGSRLLTLEQGDQLAMDLQVGITADR